MLFREAAKELDVARERAAREGGTGPDIGAGADARIGLQPLLDLGGVGADLLADRGELVRERHRQRQEGVEPVLDHLGGLDRHPDQVVTEFAQQRLEDGARALVADANHDPARVSEDLDGAAKPQIFRRTSEGDGPAGGLACERLFEDRDRSDGKLCRHEHNRAVLQMRKQHLCLPQHSVDIRAVVLVHGRVVADPDNIGVRRPPSRRS